MKTLIIDNYDSFTFNIYQLVAKVNGERPLVLKNDEASFEAIAALEVDNIILSPGPGSPNSEADFGICQRIIDEIDVPILGICLGHQGLCAHEGVDIVHAPEAMHGRVSQIRHDSDDPLFNHIPEQWRVTRYHSLIVEDKLPAHLRVLARSEEGIIMAVRHTKKPFWGVQFHPESIASDYGEQLLQNFADITRAHYDAQKYTLHWQQHAMQTNSDHVFSALLADSSEAVWLDSSRVEEGSARFSIMADRSGPMSYHLQYDAVKNEIRIDDKKIQQDLFSFLQHEIKRHAVRDTDCPFDFHGGFIGYIGYECYGRCTPIETRQVNDYPDAQFLMVDRFIVFDHIDNTVYIACLDHNVLSSDNRKWQLDTAEKIKSLSHVHVASALSESARSAVKAFCDSPEVFLSQNQAAYLQSIESAKAYIHDGHSYEVCLTNQLKFNGLDLNFHDYYQALRECNPAPYSAFLKFSDVAIACSSMERFLKIDASGAVETKPIKGTLPRGDTPKQDQALAETLANDEKFFSENLMIVDLLRNDLGQVCEIGSVNVPKMMSVESYQTVHQLVSTVRGQLRQDKTAIDCLRHCFPGGSITGAPKVRTLEIINELENRPRGVYTGAIGYISFHGEMDLNIVIRTAVKHQQDCLMGIGGAIIALSDPQEEYDEIILKAQSFIAAFQTLLTPKA